MHESGDATIFLADPGDTTPDEGSILAEQILTADERQRTHRFVRREDRHDRLVARALVRLGLSSRFDVEPAAWRFDSDQRQKPFVSDPGDLPPFQFSLSHTRGLIALLVTSATHAGVDVEHIERTNDLALVASRVCATAELESLNRLAPGAWRERFFQLWTLKEAYAKARGLGITLPLNCIAFFIDGDDVHAHFAEDIDDDPAAWQFRVRRISDQHVLASALSRDSAQSLELKLQRVRVAVADGKAALEPIG